MSSGQTSSGKRSPEPTISPIQDICNTALIIRKHKYILERQKHLKRKQGSNTFIKK